ncbi:hypothetical protein NW768_004811 [Fusarium equiseti]|uniref:Uncharacterized protein n=1 Tax=Fusarium equiseti TaxID=61235 RepID=A0ABQ8RH92_FUSEQ|nr:hypothetical protein NW768_004811 [Fusarium equiseti]
MESSDIRQVYDFERDVKAAATRLANYPPLWEGVQWSTGIDCLIVVLRHVYCNGFMSPDLAKEIEWYEQSEAKIPILRHAWHMFGQEAAEVAKATEDREKVHEVLLSLGILPFESFKDICDSSLMNETLWSQDICRLSHPPVDPTTGDDIPLSANEIAELSKLEFEPEVRGACIQDVVDKAFGHQEWKGRHMFIVPHDPLIVRVLYQADNKLCDSVSIKPVKTLKLPVWVQKEGVEYVCLEEVDRIDYFLMAVGQRAIVQILFGLIRLTAKTDAPCNYMLFYSYQPEGVGNIDVTDLPEVDDGREHGGMLDLIDSDLEEAKAKVQAGEVTDPNSRGL